MKLLNTHADFSEKDIKLLKIAIQEIYDLKVAVYVSKEIQWAVPRYITIAFQDVKSCKNFVTLYMDDDMDFTVQNEFFRVLYTRISLVLNNKIRKMNRISFNPGQTYVLKDKCPKCGNNLIFHVYKDHTNKFIERQKTSVTCDNHGTFKHFINEKGQILIKNIHYHEKEDSEC
jgi:hypothetical protein